VRRSNVASRNSFPQDKTSWLGLVAASQFDLEKPGGGPCFRGRHQFFQRLLGHDQIRGHPRLRCYFGQVSLTIVKSATVK
jgi:hypothetical protein